VLTKIDRSTSGILIVCDECPYWYAFALTMPAAHDSAVAHEERLHPRSSLAKDRRKKWATRHAD
jgi:hypothetical protein